ncbi:hypothetical protein ACFOYW_04660 [Gryllotalpicola reticulitermitis]|uniref:Uncharacterized protein n=1 Tax=Gryllotalpicola reticulitermitis TaxID=1184153 RepID=A0ABV8Q315_9MICO
MTRRVTEEHGGHHPLRAIGKVLSGIGIGIVGFVLYWVVDSLFGGFPKYHTMFWSWVAMIVTSLFGAVVWIIDERRHRDDED